VRKLRYGADARDDEQDANGAEHEANRSGNWENTCKAPSEPVKRLDAHATVGLWVLHLGGGNDGSTGLELI